MAVPRHGDHDDVARPRILAGPSEDDLAAAYAALIGGDS